MTAQQAPENWPSFRGPHAAGIATGQDLPDSWDATTGENIRWRVEVPGLAHSSPIVWGDHVFVTTAISTDSDATFTPGLYGAGTASEDTSVQQWVVMALDRHTGEVAWRRTAYEGVPKQKRHIKSTYASSTPATNGRMVVALFGSMGLYALDMNGEPLWERDLGRMNVGAYDLPDYEWGTASSPIIYGDLVIVQVDQQEDSFIIALDATTGETAWRTARDELPSWGTPTVYEAPERRTELVTNGARRQLQDHRTDTGLHRRLHPGGERTTR
jgi:outer membrane protein assembly factor BamB